MHEEFKEKSFDVPHLDDDNFMSEVICFCFEKESMMAGIPGIRTAGGSSKGEKGEVGFKGKVWSL